jgi:molecular chaperone GrpE
MKKIPITQSEQTNDADNAKEKPASASAAGGMSPDSAEIDRADADGDDSMAGVQADLDRFRDLAMRTQADFQNYKKRCAREKEEALKYANTSLLERLVAIVDNFELGLEAARSEGEKSPVFSGMSLVLKQLQDFLADNGLQPIEAVGQKFDPNLHEAIGHEPSNEVPEGKVIRQSRRGYRLKDRLLRPSSVVVSSGPAKESDQ